MGSKKRGIEIDFKKLQIFKKSEICEKWAIFKGPYKNFGAEFKKNSPETFGTYLA
jgi:hypothetical protein